MLNDHALLALHCVFHCACAAEEKEGHKNEEQNIATIYVLLSVSTIIYN